MNNVTTFRLELGEYKHPVLVVEETIQYDVKSIESPKYAAGMINDIFHLNKLAEENVVQIATDTKGQLLGMFKVSHGTVNSSFCNAREVYLRALITGATGVIIIHNHPSGISTPSGCDLETARKLNAAGELVGINLLDFIIVGDEEYYSFKEKKLI